MSVQAALDTACDVLAAGRLPDEAGRRLILRAAQSFAETPSRNRDALWRQEGLRKRDELLRELAARHCGKLTSTRAKARQISTWAVRYLTTAWQQDAHAFSCPERLAGTPQDHIWRILSGGAAIPGERRLFDIIS